MEALVENNPENTNIIKKLTQDFAKFLQQYGVIGMAVGIIMGGSVSKLVTAFVNDIMMPIVDALIPGGSWRAIIFKVGPVKFLIGDFFSAFLDFSLIIIILYWIIRIVLEKGRSLIPQSEKPKS